MEKKIIDWLKELPIEAKDKVNNYIKNHPLPIDESLDLLNEIEDSFESAVFRCLPDPTNEPFEYWYNTIHKTGLTLIEVPKESVSHHVYMGYLQFKVWNPKCTVPISEMVSGEAIRAALDKIENVPEYLDGTPIKMPGGNWSIGDKINHLDKCWLILNPILLP